MKRAHDRSNSAPQRAADMKLLVGDRVEDISFYIGLTGTVTEVIFENPSDPIVEHGFVTVCLDPEHLGRFPCSPPNEEHYVHYQWWKTLRKIEADN